MIVTICVERYERCRRGPRWPLQKLLPHRASPWERRRRRSDRDARGRPAQKCPLASPRRAWERPAAGPRGAPATSPSSSSSSRYQSAWQSLLPQMGLTFCSISFDTSSAVDGRETCQLLRSIPYLPKGLCSLARNVISLVRGGDFSRRYLGGRNRSPHPISFPFPGPAKAPCLFWLDVEVTQSSPCLLS